MRDLSIATKSGVGAVLVFVTCSLAANAAQVRPLANFQQVTFISSLSLVASSGNPANFSDLTYNPDTGTLFIIDNDNEDIYEYTTAGAPLRRITSDGFTDTEAIQYIGGGQFAIGEEGLKDITIVNINNATTAITKASGTTIVSSIAGNWANTGLEGLGYDSTLNVFYGVKEKTNMGIYRFEMDGTTTLLTALTNAAIGTGVTDFSSVYFDNAPGGHLYVLSDESNSIVELAMDGTLIATRAQAGTQPEGITFSDDGRHMFVIGEGREFFHFQAVPEPSSLALAGVSVAGLAGFVLRKRYTHRSRRRGRLE